MNKLDLNLNVDFKVAKRVDENGKKKPVGFCQVWINDVVCIHSITIECYNGKYYVNYPINNKKYQENEFKLPIVSFANPEIKSQVTDFILKEYFRVINEFDGYYHNKGKFNNPELIK